MCPTKIKTIQQLNDAVGEDYLTLRVCVYDKEPEKDNECASCSYRYFCKPKEYAYELYD